MIICKTNKTNKQTD
ncbi:rCG49070 [Rattus norvegicus]|uniref:RCG49070 n=1 Tax=Rattus norvegicus TaxID=10116 RepID=A6IGV4_RAT|nr:rCG49070 [Rattus norvegicus]